MILVLFLLLFATPIDFDQHDQVVTWNIGQGQWITAIDPKTCYHFDVGGEFYNAQKISESCHYRKNYVYLSHWDWDHIGLIHKLKRSVKSVCIVQPPLGNAKDYKKDFLGKIPICKLDSKDIQKLNFKYIHTKKDNDLSQIFIYQNRFLIPGDSTRKMEKIWSEQIKNRKLKWLAVSHHGSKTSTSEEFLKNNSSFQMAIVSARKQVYGHPHKSVVQRLKKHRIPMLKTEDWGNIRILIY